MKAIEIRLKGRIDQEWSDWFEGFTVRYPAVDQTVISGPLPDMPAVYGLLETIRNMGLEILSVRMESESQFLQLDDYGQLVNEEE